MKENPIDLNSAICLSLCVSIHWFIQRIFLKYSQMRLNLQAQTRQSQSSWSMWPAWDSHQSTHTRSVTYHLPSSESTRAEHRRGTFGGLGQAPGQESRMWRWRKTVGMVCAVQTHVVEGSVIHYSLLSGHLFLFSLFLYIFWLFFLGYMLHTFSVNLYFVF